jgi:hypothetical protein
VTAPPVTISGVESLVDRTELRVAALVVPLVLLAGCAGSDELRSPDADLTYSFDFGDTPQSTGFHLCIAGGPVDLVAVTPMRVEGDVEYLGAALVPSVDTPIGTAEGFPPAGHEAVPIEDSTVTADCDGEEVREHAQIVVGTDWGSPQGGSIVGFRVEYGYRGERGVLELANVNVVMCGAEGEFCED